MLARRFHTSLASAALILAAFFAASCEKVPLVAPTGSIITLTAGTRVLGATSSTVITATVIEAAGTPPHSGTHITFTTTLGRIEPSVVETNAAGLATVTFFGNGSNGTAIVSATSGGASTGTAGALQIALGSAAVGFVTLAADPSTLPSTGGTSKVTAIVVDTNGNALSGVPVTFTTSAGSLSTSLIATDTNGLASAIVTTSQQTTVTANVGATSGTSTGTGGTGGTGTTTPTAGQKSATVQIGVTVSPTITITPPASVSKGLPAAFTFVVTAAAQGGSPVRNVTVDWGDGEIRNLGSFVGSQQVFHVFKNDGTYNVTATVTDVTGYPNFVSASIVVSPVASPTIIPTPSVPNTCTGSGNCTVTFQIQVIPPSGVGIVNVSVTFGEPGKVTPETQGLGGLTGSATITATYVAHAGPQTITVSVTDTLGRTTQGFTTINIP